MTDGLIGTPEEWAQYIWNLEERINKVRSEIIKATCEKWTKDKIELLEIEFQSLSMALERCKSDFEKVDREWQMTTAEYEKMKQATREALDQ